MTIIEVSRTNRRFIKTAGKRGGSAGKVEVDHDSRLIGPITEAQRQELRLQAQDVAAGRENLTVERV